MIHYVTLCYWDQQGTQSFHTGCLYLTLLSTTSWNLSAINTRLWTRDKLVGDSLSYVNRLLPLVVDQQTNTVGGDLCYITVYYLIYEQEKEKRGRITAFTKVLQP